KISTNDKINEESWWSKLSPAFKLLLGILITLSFLASLALIGSGIGAVAGFPLAGVLGSSLFTILNVSLGIPSILASLIQLCCKPDTRTDVVTAILNFGMGLILSLSGLGLLSGIHSIWTSLVTGIPAFIANAKFVWDTVSPSSAYVVDGSEEPPTPPSSNHYA